MQTKQPERGSGGTAQPPPSAVPAKRGAAIQVARTPATTVLLLSLAGSLALVLSCAEPTSLERSARKGSLVFLNVAAATAVRTVLADVSFRIGDAIEDGATRTQFENALARLTANIEEGLLDAANGSVAEARAALAAASTADADGSGDADRAAIALAISVATEEITNARLAAGGR